MSHERKTFVYAYSTNKKSIEARLSTYAEVRCVEEHGGLPCGIDWKDSKIYDSEADARQAIEEMSTARYNCIAVPFRQADTSAKKFRELQAKECAAWNAYNTASREVVAKSFKSQYLGCKNCGSKLNKDFLRTNMCPLCGKDMRSPTELQRIARLKVKAEAASASREAEERAMGKKSKNIYWLVQIEYHI